MSEKEHMEETAKLAKARIEDTDLSEEERDIWASIYINAMVELKELEGK